jgi:Arc/MetJ-type ribon-helix-helix transcriptional regulator
MKTKLIRINPVLSQKLQKKLDRHRKSTGLFKSAAAYVNELIELDLREKTSN